MSHTDFDPENNKSEVARMRWLIERNCEALQRVSNDPGFSARHEAVRRRYSALGKREEQLAELVGKEKANAIVCDVYNAVMNRTGEEEPHEDIEALLAQHEAAILRRDRYRSDAEFRRDVGWWMVYMRIGCERLRQHLRNPAYAASHEKLQDVLARRMARLTELEHMLSDGKEKRE